ncbi:MAG TPA: type III polyketide synthase [Ktedonobacterales bacterium]|nr:type III polyketide synthase [Ktedonobacterales bacterium]
MNGHPRIRILAIASAHPARRYSQEEMLAFVQVYLLGPDWRDHPAKVERAHALAQTFAAAQITERQCTIDLPAFYHGRRSTGERMTVYRDAAYALGGEALRAALAGGPGGREPTDITDLFVISCTGYAAPGIDVSLARDLGMSRSVRRVGIGHMGCFGALVGLRQSLATARAYPDATVAMLAVEVCSLHLRHSDDPETLTSFALFGDGAAALLIGQDETATGPEIVDSYCAADFASAEQMSWTITDEGFVMGLSPRVPVTLRRNIASAVEGLLAPHDLRPSDITHWIVHPGGPSILTVIQRQMELSDEQMALSWQVLRERGNCSSATVLLILEELVRSGRPRRGEWGVMMAFGPGLTLETCLLRF